jgi:hypothetical protein
MNYAHLIIIECPANQVASVRYYDGTYLGTIRPVYLDCEYRNHLSARVVFNPVEEFEQTSIRTQVAVAQKIQELNESGGWNQIIANSLSWFSVPLSLDSRVY